MLNLGWVDFSRSDRDMVLSVLLQLTEPGAMDELGIGTIRDGFSDILFPGTSTIQTRAKYFFIVPYLCMELEREHNLPPSEFIEALETKEIDLIDVLAVNGADGVIGQRSRQTLRRKPSSIYWNALRTFGILAESVSLSEYASLLYSRRIASDQLKTLGKRHSHFDDDATDDINAGNSGVTFWRVPLSANWRENLRIELTAEEAVCLRDKINTQPKTRDSLLALVLRKEWKGFTLFNDFNELDALQSLMTPELRGDYQLARDFSRFIFGAQVRYNIIYSNGENEHANELWRQYTDEKPGVNLDKIRARFKPRTDTIRFLKTFEASVDDEKRLDALIVSREKDLKGPARAKLSNKELYSYDGNSINMERLVYRLPVARRIVRDIFEGIDAHA